VSGPIEDPLEKCLCGIRVILAVEEVELRLACAVVSVEGRFSSAGDAPYIPPIPRGDEKVGVGVFVKRMAVSVEHHPDILHERGAPLGVALVEPIGKLHKPLALFTATGIDFLKGKHLVFS
jgi:hypothetical protein